MNKKRLKTLIKEYTNGYTKYPESLEEIDALQKMSSEAFRIGYKEALEWDELYKKMHKKYDKL